VNCEDLLCIKGDPIKAAAIRQQYAETDQLLTEALKASNQGVSGANRWVEHQQRTLARLEQLCQILDDPKVSEGTFIQLSPQGQASRLNQESPASDARALPLPQPS
jgi:ABC-type transporter Mla subunit MlaD